MIVDIHKSLAFFLLPRREKARFCEVGTTGAGLRDFNNFCRSFTTALVKKTNKVHLFLTFQTQEHGLHSCTHIEDSHGSPFVHGTWRILLGFSLQIRPVGQRHVEPTTSPVPVNLSQ